MFQMAHDSNMGKMNFAWRLSLKSHFDKIGNFRAILQVSNDLPTFPTKQLHNDFIEIYS